VKILITGICGFVGFELAAGLMSLKDADIEIVGIDNLSRKGSWVNRESLLKKGVSVLHGDIRCASDLETLGPVNCVIDAAANASVLAGVDGKTSTRQLVENNLCGTLNLLEFCKTQRAAFILLSTSRVYAIEALSAIEVAEFADAFRPSETTNLPGFSRLGISEDFSTAAPISLYGATKLSSEQLAQEYGRAFDFPVWINRCSVMAGAGQFARADQGIFSYWLHSWRERKPLKYIGFGGKGHQVRDCLHPRDLVTLIFQQCKTRNDRRPAVINLSGGIESARSLLQLSQWCTSHWGEHFVHPGEEVRPFDLPWVVLDHSLAAKTWNWHPATDVEQILSEIAGFAETQNAWTDLTA